MVHDQAESLREKANGHPSTMIHTKVLVVTSGKGGVGKSNFTLNFAISLVELGQKVVILDADLGLANLDVLMGVSPKNNLFQMVENRYSIWEIIEKGPGGIEFIAGYSDFSKLYMLDDQKLGYLFEQLNQLEGYADIVIIDTGAGLSRESLQFILAADEIVLVTTPEPTSITDGYTVIKMLHSKNPFINPKLVVNRATSEQEGQTTAERISIVAKRFLNIDLTFIGMVNEDQNVSKSVKRQEPLLLAYPNTVASENLRKIARMYLQPDKKEDIKGMKGFLQKMLNFIK